MPESLPAVLAVIVSAGLAGYFKLSHCAPPVDQLVTVQDAVDKSDLYYKLMSSAISQRSRDATKMSNAFKATAEGWLTESLVRISLPMANDSHFGYLQSPVA